MPYDRIVSIRLRRIVGALLLSAGLAAPAADTAEEAHPAQAENNSRRGPALEDTAGMVYVITPDDIRRSGAETIRPVPGLDVVGRFEGSTRAR